MTTSIELNVAEVEVSVSDKLVVDLFLYECPGNDVFNNVHSRHFKHASYILCVYDVLSRESFLNCSKWIRSVQTVAASAHVIIVANKIDIGGDGYRVFVDAKEGQQFAKGNGYSFFECSALKGEGVEEPFKYMANDVSKNYTAENA